MDDDATYGGNQVPDWLEYQSLSWQHFPCLANSHPPDNTIVTHCVCHRDFYNSDREQDIFVRLSGDAGTVEMSMMEAPTASPANPTEEVAPWVHQNF